MLRIPLNLRGPAVLDRDQHAASIRAIVRTRGMYNLFHRPSIIRCFLHYESCKDGRIRPSSDAKRAPPCHESPPKAKADGPQVVRQFATALRLVALRLRHPTGVDF